MNVTAAEPVTEAQRARYRRMVDVATMLVTTGGEEALQMSEMPSLAEVSLATLYRYFPSKEHLLFAVVERYLESALARTRPNQRPEAPVRERVASHLLRVFEFDQRVPTMASVVRRVSAVADPVFRAQRERIVQLHHDIVLKAAGPMSAHQEQVLWIAMATFGAAVENWLVGSATPDGVRFAILIVCRMFDLPADEVTTDRHTASRASRPNISP